MQGPQPTAGKVLYLGVISLAGSDSTSMSQMWLFAMVKSLQDRMECHIIVCRTKSSQSKRMRFS